MDTDVLRLGFRFNFLEIKILFIFVLGTDKSYSEAEEKKCAATAEAPYCQIYDEIMEPNNFNEFSQSGIRVFHQMVPSTITQYKDGRRKIVNFYKMFSNGL